MNKHIARVLYHTHDNRNENIKHREDLIKFLEFCITHERFKTEMLLIKIINRVETNNSLLVTKGIINMFQKELPELMRDYFIVYDSNKLKEYYKD